MFFQKIFPSTSYHLNSSILPSDLHLGSASVLSPYSLMIYYKNLKISNKTAWNFSCFLCYFKSQAAENYLTVKTLL
ncbi:unnamed protein product [Rhizophagus irregularis]|nr:unnamed protein product [Rhizophagus irregularis]